MRAHKSVIDDVDPGCTVRFEVPRSQQLLDFYHGRIQGQAYLGPAVYRYSRRGQRILVYPRALSWIDGPPQNNDTPTATIELYCVPFLGDEASWDAYPDFPHAMTERMQLGA